MSEAEQVKICVECKHHSEERFNAIGISPNSPQISIHHDCMRLGDSVDLVTGEKSKRRLDCRSERQTHEGCSFSGRFWEAK